MTETAKFREKPHLGDGTASIGYREN